MLNIIEFYYFNFSHFQKEIIILAANGIQSFGDTRPVHGLWNRKWGQLIHLRILIGCWHQININIFCVYFILVSSISYTSVLTLYMYFMWKKWGSNIIEKSIKEIFTTFLYIFRIHSSNQLDHSNLSKLGGNTE